MTDNERKVLELNKTLAPLPTELLEEYKWHCIWWDWDINCHFCDMMEFSQSCGDYQVIRHYDVEMEKCEVGFENEEERVCTKGMCEEFADDEVEECLYENPDGTIEGAFFYNECKVMPEWGRHWVNVKTGEVVFLGRPQEDPDYVCNDDSQEWEVLHEGETFFDRYNDYYGNFHYMDLDMHPALMKMGFKPIDLFERSEEIKEETGDCDLHRGLEVLAIGANETHGDCDMIRFDRTPYHRVLANAMNEEKYRKVGGHRLVTIMYLEDKPKKFFDACRMVHRCKREDLLDNNKWWRYIKLLADNNKDCCNRALVCPDNLEDSIARILREEESRRRREEEQRIRRQQELMAKSQGQEYEINGAKWEEDFAKKKGDYIHVEFEYDGIKYKVVPNVKEYMKLGIDKVQCVFSHRYFEQEDCILMTAYLNGKYVETLNINTKTGLVVECHGNRNQNTPLHDAVIQGGNIHGYLFKSIRKKKHSRKKKQRVAV